MGINISEAAFNCNLVTQTFDKEKLTGHSYLAVNRDDNGAITGCRLTENRDERASLLEINEFANICLQQYNREDNLELIKDIHTIKNCVRAIRTNVDNNKDQNCLNGLWFFLKFGNSIIHTTQEIIHNMSVITEIFENHAEVDQEEAIAKLALARAKAQKKNGQNSQALNNYIIASNNGNLEATHALINSYSSSRWGQKEDIEQAYKYCLKAADMYLKLNDQEAFSLVCRKAFQMAGMGQRALLDIIERWQVDITTIFSIAEIQGKVSSYDEIEEAYDLNARAFINQGNWDKALEQCQFLETFDPINAESLRHEIANKASK